MSLKNNKTKDGEKVEQILGKRRECNISVQHQQIRQLFLEMFKGLFIWTPIYRPGEITRLAEISLTLILTTISLERLYGKRVISPCRYVAFANRYIGRPIYGLGEITLYFLHINE